jgi:hypothetical protein
MHTKTITLYSFDELSARAKEKARSWWRESSAGDSFWSESTIEDAKEQGKFMGLDISNIYFSGFSCQGDGACFEGSWNASDVKPGETAKDWGDSPATTKIKRIASSFEELAKKYPEASFNVKHSGHYSHKYCTLFFVSLGEELDNNENFTQKELSEAEGEIIEAARDYMQWIYRQLETEYEYQNSDEQVDESICSNGYSFTEDGEIE